LGDVWQDKKSTDKNHYCTTSSEQHINASIIQKRTIFLKALLSNFLLYALLHRLSDIFCSVSRRLFTIFSK